MSIVTQIGNTRLYGRHKEALDLLSSGNARDAIQILLELADADPNNHLVCLDIGKTVLKMGMADQAIVAARQAIELDSTSVEAFMLLAQALEIKGDIKDANVALARAVDILRSPFCSDEDFLKAEDAKPKPLIIADQSAIFMKFDIEGDVSSLSLKSLSTEKGSAHILHITISGEPRTQADNGYQIEAEGDLKRDMLLQSLPQEVANAVKIFPAGSFSYTISRKIIS
jgi:tetratricopeptide (TPR) repeat protein